ncbi:hypothetical protein MPTK1_4g15760 [Marchantia polymorpha subsp. ruderalis]|uniref:Uncharacterized protein n=2 Tax=Marchantia polymorpha TaxID=3197 RepID=A0AAF6BAA7_MARPO|nr:hypothetical protein MARPO_0054s0041 [Marchantia polymorpha]BBN08941.1 hypothetical protein Mp_4g15760 [Marchantia polymorpha subsp. ruderalis]|eukprot:PTQ37928.1 hypothetical protein MARPO_0054s0041 [Marchantia polymorpha]
MAASARTMSLSSTAAVAPSRLSSLAAFTSPVVSAVPFNSAPSLKNSINIRATYEEPRAARREMLAGLIATGAALASAGSALAASGPGIPGAKRTAQKADELLKAGDDLINNDSPPRFGGSRVEGSLKNSGKIAQQAGSGAVEGLQDGASKTIEGAKKNAKIAQARIDGIFGKKNVVANNPLEKAAGSVKGGVDDLLKNGSGKIKADVRTAADKVKSDVASTRGLGKKANSKAGNIVDQARDNASNAVEEGKGVLGNIKNQITALHFPFQSEGSLSASGPLYLRKCSGYAASGQEF